MGFEEASFKERYQETENSFRQESQKIENFKASGTGLYLVFC